MVVETKSLVDVIFLFIYDSLLPLVLVKGPDPKIAVVKISKCEEPLLVLDYLLHLYVIIL